MLKSTKKISILLNDIYYQLSYRFFGNRKPLIIWGRSPYLEFGPGIRTRRFKSIIEKKSINKICIYMQSHWPWYDIVIYTFLGRQPPLLPFADLSQCCTVPSLSTR